MLTNYTHPCYNSEPHYLQCRVRSFGRLIRNNVLKMSYALGRNESLKTIARWTVLAGVLAYLLYQLSNIGWDEIAAALPTSPLFYLLSIGFVLVPVLAEILSFQTIVVKRTSQPFKVFLRKHVLNKAVMNFSGDAYFIQSLSKYNELGLRRAAIILKDMTIIRVFVSNAWIVCLAMAIVLMGKFDILKNIASASPALVLALSGITLSILGGTLILFRKVTKLEFGVVRKVASIYLARSLVIGMILMSQWSLAMPGHGIATWFVFLIIFYMTKKSPVGGELIFASVVLTLPGLTGDPAAVAAMLIAIAAVTQVFYFISFLLSLEANQTRRVS